MHDGYKRETQGGKSIEQGNNQTGAKKDSRSGETALGEPHL